MRKVDEIGCYIYLVYILIYIVVYAIIDTEKMVEVFLFCSIITLIYMGISMLFYIYFSCKYQYIYDYNIQKIRNIIKQNDSYVDGLKKHLLVAQKITE